MPLQNKVNLILLLLFRENWPAGDGDFRKLPFYLFQQLGSLFLLLLIASVGLWIVNQEHVLRDRLTEIANSPYMAIFIEGYMYGTEGGSGHGSDPHEPAYWRNLTLDTLVHDTTGLPLGKEHVFESVSVYSDGYLSFLDRENRQRSGFKGLVLDFVNTERRNERLLNGLHVAAGESWKWDDIRNVNGIIMSSQLMKSLGFAKPWPNSLKLQKDNYGNSDPRINVSFPLVVLDDLPYRKFIIPRRIYNRLGSGFYSETAESVRVFFFTEEASSAKALEQLGKEFPQAITEGLQRYSDLYCTWLSYPSPGKRRMDILDDFSSLPPSTGQVYFDGDGEPAELSRYSGAMLYLNRRLMLMGKVQARLIPALSGFINQQVDQQVHSEILEILNTTLSNQAMLQRLSGLLKTAAFALAVILALYNAVVLHSRIYRIGVLREQGASARLFVMVLIIQSLIFTVLAFGLALLIHGLYSQGMTVSQLMGTPEAYKLLVGLSVAAVVGHVVPAIVHINLMEPSEMVSYRA